VSDYIFISYARLDNDYATHLAQLLKEHGLSIWMDQWNIPLGADWDRAIDDAIRGCAGFLIILSPAALVSEHAGEVRGELRRALDSHRLIVPVLYKPCDIPRQLLHLEYVDLSSGVDDTSVNRLVNRLKGLPVDSKPPTDRLTFIETLQRVPEDARAFDEEFTHSMAVEISKRLTDLQFNAVSHLKERHDQGAIGIVRSLAMERIGGHTWEAAQTFETLVQFGFLALSSDPRERDDPDPGYQYTPLFFGYRNLQRYLGIGDAPTAVGGLGPTYWLSSKETNGGA
jgi:hypothetical protein